MLLQGSICSLTEKIRTRTCEEIIYEASDSKINEVKDILRDIKDYCKQRGYYLLITTILPVSLRKTEEHYSSKGKRSSGKFDREEKAEQQVKLEEDIKDLNEYIVNLFHDNTSSVVNVNRLIESRSIKKLG